jgi:hypothetical protein
MNDFQAKGKLPIVEQPSSPLITYLESLTTNQRLALKHVRIVPRLGYQTMAKFSNAQLLLNYLKPRTFVLGQTPASSYQIKGFTTRVTSELFNACQKK